ncbi:glycerophosphodiester phosphodiesterase GDPDL7-like [Cornus florida]|uniref:glycerophosphodiester phosphodiesterase GDPDL7-like n=1 Tax=Cornus florida TaxID=4283 RepID=UPI002896F2DF|nr:glycerophosphodiester phosphodiesterase GDPDL7-like [Cornus florida]
MALSNSLDEVVLSCELQLSKDNRGFCMPDLTLQNSTDIQDVFRDRKRSYKVNGQEVEGWFANDYTAHELYHNVTIMQSVMSRTAAFDRMPTFMIDDIPRLGSSKRRKNFWLSVQHSTFYTENKLDPASYIKNISNFVDIDYVSSTDLNFLRKLNGQVKNTTKIIFQFLPDKAIEPTTKQEYGSLLKNLSSIKSFASGILVPKVFIWPVCNTSYLKPATSLVVDAHKLGLEVYASCFANDILSSYNYSYDPTAEYLQFIDNSEFAVDGVLTDFPSTASETIACLANNKNRSRPAGGKPLIITSNGASGVYPGCTDLAYQQAVDDGADVIDCSVQMSKDGVAFCLGSPDLTLYTTALATFTSRSAKIPEIKNNSGIFSFDLTWNEIQTLKPQIHEEYARDGFRRNPVNKNVGKLVTLSEFLEFSKKKAVSGILINIDHAAFFASHKGLNLYDSVAKALSDASYDKQSNQKVLIQSDDSSVLSKFKDVSNYRRVLNIRKLVSNVSNEMVEEVKKYADAVNLRKFSIIPTSNYLTLPNTNAVEKMHAANISVYVSTFRNEFITIAHDYFGDPMVELATHIIAMGVDGIVTEYPATANAYLRSPCADPKTKTPYSILPVMPGSLLSLINPKFNTPADSPTHPLATTDVVDPPLPPVSNVSHVSKTAATAPAPQQSGQAAQVANVGLCLVATLVLSLLTMGH